MKNKWLTLAVIPAILGAAPAVACTGCVTTEVVSELPASQPPFRLTKIEKHFSRTAALDGGILKLRLVGELLQAGWESADRIYSHSFALQFPVGERLDERRKVIQWFLQFQILFRRRKGAPRLNPFDVTFNIPLKERDVKNCVIQVVSGDTTEDFLLFHKGRYYPEGKPYQGGREEKRKGGKEEKRREDDKN